MRNWKKSIRKLSIEIINKAESLSPDIQVGAVKKIGQDEIKAGTYSHMGLRLDDAGDLMLNGSVLPPAEGRWSIRNRDGWIEKHKDQPMETYEVSFETPNFGDWSRGSHTVTWTKERYRKTLHQPRLLKIQVTEIGRAQGGYFIRFLISGSIVVGEDGWLDELFFFANLLQENVGAFDVYSANATMEDFLATVRVSWQLFPAGDGETVIRILVGKAGKKTPAEVKEIKERVKVLESLKPVKLIVGTDGFQHYFGAVLEDDLVVFENIKYGNAIYVMDDGWEELTRKSRSELLAQSPDKFTRIVHTSGWEKKLRTEIKKRRSV